MFRRMLPFGGLAAVFSLALAGSAAAGGGGPIPPGQSQFSSVDASFFSGPPKGAPGPFVSLFARSGQSIFEPDEGPPVQQQGTTLSLSIFATGGGGGGGCFMIPDSAFSVSSDLKSARLGITITKDTPTCPGKRVAATPDGLSGANSAVVIDGGGGGGGNLALPVTLDVSWTARTATFTSHFSNSSECLDFSASGESTSQRVGANVQASISTVNGGAALTSRFGDVSRSSSEFETSGSFPAGCF